MNDAIRFRMEAEIGYLQLHRPAANNSINQAMIDGCRQVMDHHSADLLVLVIEGLPEVFCSGGDFQAVSERQNRAPEAEPEADSQALYDLWLQLTTGPFISLAHVRGKTSAGGVGFAAACDIVIADTTASFNLSELIFGLYPACVWPFLERRIGQQRAHYLTLSTTTIDAKTALSWGLADAVSDNSADLLRRHLLRLRRVSKRGIVAYKAYRQQLNDPLQQARPIALQHNRAMFDDPKNLAAIANFVEQGIFPWETKR